MTDNITFHTGEVTADDRRRLSGSRPTVVWFTGLSGSGKSTIAVELERLLVSDGYPAYLLDGDNLRFGLNAGLGFSPADREENIRRIAEAARLIADSGQTAIVSAISPARESRERARARISEKADFIGVYVDTPLEECARRDVKGLYKKAFSGEIKEFTGVSAPYEPPVEPDIHIVWSPDSSAGEEAKRVFDYITARRMDYARLLETMKSAAVEAGERILEIYGRNFSVEQKADSSPLTEADLASNELITRFLSSEYPYIPLLTEESADDRSRLRSRFCFIVDPLDGTKEFIKRNGEFTVNIALAYDHVSVAGVIYVPVTGELYFAAKGRGAFRTRNGSTERIAVSKRTDGLVVMESRSHNSSEAEKLFERNSARIAKVISAGSSLKGCRVAEGIADVYYRFGPTMEWDTAAMQIICEEAGAVFRQLDGYDSPMYYNRTHTRNDMGFYIVNNEESGLK